MLGLCATIVKLRRGADPARNNNLPHDALGPPHRNGDLREQLPRDAKPSRIKRLSAYVLACPKVSVGCVALIAFLAMRIGVNPRTIAAFVLLSGLVRPRPSVNPAGGSVAARDWRNSSKVI
jgi:hypothetical protein